MRAARKKPKPWFWGTKWAGHFVVHPLGALALGSSVGLRQKQADWPPIHSQMLMGKLPWARPLSTRGLRYPQTRAQGPRLVGSVPTQMTFTGAYPVPGAAPGAVFVLAHLIHSNRRGGFCYAVQPHVRKATQTSAAELDWSPPLPRSSPQRSSRAVRRAWSPHPHVLQPLLQSKTSIRPGIGVGRLPGQVSLGFFLGRQLSSEGSI